MGDKLSWYAHLESKFISGKTLYLSLLNAVGSLGAYRVVLFCTFDSFVQNGFPSHYSVQLLSLGRCNKKEKGGEGTASCTTPFCSCHC